MGTKNSPGKFDCYANAEPDEPMFVLLGRDPTAWLVVDWWVKIRRELGKTDPAKLAEAEECMAALLRWAHAHGKSAEMDAARQAAGDLLIRLAREAVEGH